jgi:hypothetical protein
VTEFSMEIKAPRRRAEVTIKSWWAKKLALEEGVQPCHVLGVFQYIEDSDCAYPVFVCELDDGRVIEVATSDVKFVDTEGGIII